MRNKPFRARIIRAKTDKSKDIIQKFKRCDVYLYYPTDFHGNIEYDSVCISNFNPKPMEEAHILPPDWRVAVVSIEDIEFVKL